MIEASRNFNERTLHELSEGIELKTSAELELLSHLYRADDVRKRKRGVGEKTKTMNSIVKFVRTHSGAANMDANYRILKRDGEDHHTIIVVGPKNATTMLRNLLAALTYHVEANTQQGIADKIARKGFLKPSLLTECLTQYENGMLRSSQVSQDFNAKATSDSAAPKSKPASKQDKKSRHKHKIVAHFTPRNEEQTAMARSIREGSLLTLALGPAGTGKTRVACALALEFLQTGKIDRIVLSRPQVSSAKHNKRADGALPGGEEEKMMPFLRPLYSQLREILGGGDTKFHADAGDRILRQMLSDGVIEIKPLETIRGESLKHTFVILDEAQNADIEQMQMFLTRPGEGCVTVVAGDPEQSDIDPRTCGLTHFTKHYQELLKKDPDAMMSMKGVIDLVGLTQIERGVLTKAVLDVYAYARKKDQAKAEAKAEVEAKPAIPYGPMP